VSKGGERGGGGERWGLWRRGWGGGGGWGEGVGSGGERRWRGGEERIVGRVGEWGGEVK